ncbi:hypothetical protein LMG31506_05788 [Cupriavidus yeoncheonensis]|uniref:HTH cro/C1-type domain-containing protein n=1 Tax=Cupriavidus yeoncheonensis TaxID=1462994 RepID=A0A916MY49_9BURK|nr:helix-turn-helix transcriptional regulator [Cupriavidus yeoncheonensis]CAG2156699.1 hypothetical protein LMG31506_05788 [Cupriavidus yeoncheonensis]
MNLEEAFGQAVRLKRRHVGLSQDQLAGLLELQQGAVSRLENGYVSATLDMVGRVAAALRTTPAALLQDAQNLPGYVPVADGKPRRSREAD